MTTEAAARSGSIQTIAFIGLGVMGYPMAAHLAAAGYQLRIYNRTAQTAQRWLDEHGVVHGGTAHGTPAAAADGADLACLCVGDDPDVLAVCLGAHGVFETLSPHAALVDHTTASMTVALTLAERAAKIGAACLDAPVSGGQAGAENAALTIMCGGTAKDFERLQPVLSVYGKRVRRVGEAGAGQLTKMVNQICIAGVLQGLAEGLHFARRSGLDIDAVVDVISAGAAQSWQMQNRAATMATGRFDFGFAVDWMRKDLRIALQAARDNGARLPLTALIDQFYADIQAAGGGRQDTSSLIQRLDSGT